MNASKKGRRRRRRMPPPSAVAIPPPLLMDKLIRAMADPRFTQLLTDFYDTRDVLSISPALDPSIRQALTDLLGLLLTMLRDQDAVQWVEGKSLAEHTINIAEATECVDQVRALRWIRPCGAGWAGEGGERPAARTDPPPQCPDRPTRTR